MSFVSVAVSMAALLGQQDAAFENFFEEFAKRRDHIAFLSAPFDQTTITRDETVVSVGTVVYGRPKRLLFYYDDPPQVFALDGLRAYEFDPELEQLQVFEIEDQPHTAAFFLGFEDDAARLREAYEVRILPRTQAEEGGIAVQLRPKAEEDREALFDSVTLFLRGQDYLPTKINIQNNDESEVLILLGEITVKETVVQEEVQIFLPEGTDIIENDAYIETVGAGGRYVPGPLEEEGR